MIPIIQLIVSFSIAVLLGVIAYYMRKSYIASQDSWIFYDNLRGEAEDVNKKLDELNKFMKSTFKDFADNTKDVIEMKKAVPQTTKIIGMDGREHVVPVDIGW